MKVILPNSLKFALALLLAAALFGAGISPAGHAAAACAPNASFDLYAKSGTVALYGAVTTNIWGYAANPGDAPSLPGPAIVVNEGDCVQVNLHNNLVEVTGLEFHGQGMTPDLTGVSAGGTQTYIFTAANPGSFLYEAGLIQGTQHQAAMGMYGALIVRPSSGPGYAYNNPATAFAREAVLVLSEVDPALNNSAAPASFDMRSFAPKYFLVNGKAYPDTAAIAALSGETVLLRYINAGMQSHAMSTLGVSQKAIAVDGHPYAHPHRMVAETIATGQTLDVLTSLPVGAADGTQYAIYDANSMLRNSSTNSMGGMLVYLNVGATPPGGSDTTGPAVVASSLAPNPTNGTAVVSISATVSDAATGGSNVAQAEFYIDSTAGAANALTGAFGSPIVSVSGSISISTLSALASGNHTIFIRGQDSLGNWGSFLPVTLSLDKSGPATSGLSLSPNPSSGAVAVALSATGNDTASGGSAVAAAEYKIDSGAMTAMTAVGLASPVRTFSAVIPAGLSMGMHVVSVRSQDAFGNWGPIATINLQIADTAAPATSAVSASPNPNNGALGFNTSIPAVRVTANFSDVATGNSNLAAAEGFLDTIGTTGTGFAFIASDGSFNSPTESGYGDIPLAVVGALTTGNHTIYVHAKDAPGNWGAMSTTVLVIDRTPPAFNGLSISPNPTNGAAVMTLSVLNSTGSPTGGEYWYGATAPAVGGGTQFSGMTPSIPVPANGTYTVNARIRDAANNWSAAQSTTLTVVPDAIFSNGFEAGNTNAWSSRSTNNTTRLNVTASAALAGMYGLQAQGSNANYVQLNFSTSSTTFDARFAFNPHGNTASTQDIFSAGSTSGFAATLFRVRYRWNAGSPQVQIQVGTTNTNAAWTGITNNAANVIQVTWQAGGSLRLYVNGVLAQTLTAGSGSLAAFRLGSVTSGGSSILEYFDAFAAKRTLTPLLP